MHAEKKLGVHGNKRKMWYARLLHLPRSVVYCEKRNFEGGRSMKRKKRTALWIVLAVLLAVGGICIWQRNNIRALILSRTMTQEELTDQMTQQQEKTEQAAQAAGVSVRPMTEEEKDQLRSGEESRETLIERLTEAQKPEETEKTPEQADDTPAAQPDPQTALREELNKCVAEVYVMEAEYTGWLEQANQSAIDEFNALPEAEQTSSAKYDFGMKYLSAALQKEQECDARMQDVEARIRSLLTQLGESTSLADEIQTTYTEKKATLKAYYLGLH